MRLVEAVKASDCGTVRYKGHKWSICRNYEGKLDMIAHAGGGWCEFFLSNYYDKDLVDAFEPVMKDEDT